MNSDDDLNSREILLERNLTNQKYIPLYAHWQEIFSVPMSSFSENPQLVSKQLLK
jgi:hypothetical protein